MGLGREGKVQVIKFMGDREEVNVKTAQKKMSQTEQVS